MAYHDRKVRSVWTGSCRGIHRQGSLTSVPCWQPGYRRVFRRHHRRGRSLRAATGYFVSGLFYAIIISLMRVCAVIRLPGIHGFITTLLSRSTLSTATLLLAILKFDGVCNHGSTGKMRVIKPENPQFRSGQPDHPERDKWRNPVKGGSFEASRFQGFLQRGGIREYPSRLLILQVPGSGFKLRPRAVKVKPPFPCLAQGLSFFMSMR